MIKKAHKSAAQAQKKAYAPYSQFKVGAAITSGAALFTGCNVENASYGGTVCAERVAIWTAVAAGTKSFDNVVVVTDSEVPAPPCGFCLQVMAEFCKPATRVWLANPKEILKVYELRELLPKPFGPDFLDD
ncbi:MAG TPA: cytidine deaminase [Bdellovibrionales bacterium]|nr:cytidine deaminase [Bdellovibrionales bacterium]